MELNEQIKKYRTEMNLSQEELAEKIYVTRQSVSNWENGKTYPDIHSLLLLGSLFGISLDQLVKGDIEIMKKEIKEAEIIKMKRYGRTYTLMLIATAVSAVPLLCGSVFGHSFLGESFGQSLCTLPLRLKR